MSIKPGAGVFRALYRSAILDYARDHGPVPISELGMVFNIEDEALNSILAELRTDRLIIVDSDQMSKNSRVDFNRSGLSVISLDVGGTKIYGAVTDLEGRIYEELLVPSLGESGDTEAIDQITRVISNLITHERLANHPLIGIGVGAPGVADTETGIVSLAPALKWESMPLKTRLESHFHIPVFVGNDVNLMALGEYGFGQARGTANMICIAVGTGIGMGVIINGALYHGSQNAAGEIGYMVPGREFLEGRFVEGFGALEKIASGVGIAENARMLISQQDDNEQLTAETVIAQARSGAGWANRIIQETVDYLTLAIANVTVLFDPEVIVLSGGVMSHDDLFLNPMSARMSELVPMKPRLMTSTLGPKATVLGATMLVIQGLTHPYTLIRTT